MAMEKETEKALVKRMVDKAPKPDEMDDEEEAFGGAEEHTPAEKDTDADDAVEDSAYRDFAKAIKDGDDAAGKAALKDFIEACYKGK